MYVIKKITYILFFLCCLNACKAKQEEPFVFPKPGLLEEITKRGVLNVCTYYNTTDYYVYKGVTKGFHYELVKDFADYLGVKLHVEVNSDMEECIQELNEGKYDLIAMSLSVSENRKKKILFTNPFFKTHSVLVQNKKRKEHIDSLSQLSGKDIYIQKGTSYEEFLQQLKDSLHLEFNISPLTEATYEDILVMVENNEVEFTVTDHNIAKIAAHYMPYLDYSLHLSDEFPIAWGTALNGILLTEELNAWLNNIKKSGKFNVLYNRYFNSSYVTSLHNSKYYKLKNGKISSFDPIIKKAARTMGWDWRLLAAIIFQESKFDPEAVSWLGAVGLMQVMPETALSLGIEDYTDPKDNIRAGTTYLKRLEKIFSKYPLTEEDQIKFTLAAYNAGPGHVIDAMKLAEAYNKDPYVWNNNVDYFLLHKSNPEFYRDTLIQHGYCDGRQAYDFVNNILENYSHYKNTIPE